MAEVSAQFPSWDIVIGSHEVWKPVDALKRIQDLSNSPEARVAIANETHV